VSDTGGEKKSSVRIVEMRCFTRSRNHRSASEIGNSFESFAIIAIMSLQRYARSAAKLVVFPFGRSLAGAWPEMM